MYNDWRRCPFFLTYIYTLYLFYVDIFFLVNVVFIVLFLILYTPLQLLELYHVIQFYFFLLKPSIWTTCINWNLLQTDRQTKTFPLLCRLGAWTQQKMCHAAQKPFHYYVDSIIFGGGNQFVGPSFSVLLGNAQHGVF